jgi:hypothetical protein
MSRIPPQTPYFCVTSYNRFLIVIFTGRFVAYTPSVRPLKPHFALFQSSDILLLRLLVWKDAQLYRRPDVRFGSTPFLCCFSYWVIYICIKISQFNTEHTTAAFNTEYLKEKSITFRYDLLVVQGLRRSENE